MNLIDTNIFLEILLGQEKQEICKKFLNDNIKKLAISDFSLHSIGVILFRLKEIQTWTLFLADVLPNVTVLSISKEEYVQLSDISIKFKLDFDDAYQTTVAQLHQLKIVTMDKDYKKVSKEQPVVFL